MPRHLSHLVIAASFTLAAASSHAAGVAYISSSSGYLLHQSGGAAVTAKWNGQAPIQGFAGYGRIQINGQCLSARQGGQPLRWEGCSNGDKSQIWALNGSKLNNELGWCADVEGGRGGAGVRVLAWQCSGAGNQQWRAHRDESAQSVAGRIAQPQARAAFVKNASSAQPGSIISLSTGQVVSAGGANVIASGGGNVIATGGGNVVAAGGMN